MPRCFFHLHDGCTYWDKDGINVPDMNAVHKEAIRISTEFLTSEKGKLWKHKELRLDVTDANGLIVFSLTFLVENRNAKTNSALLTGVLAPA